MASKKRKKSNSAKTNRTSNAKKPRPEQIVNDTPPNTEFIVRGVVRDSNNVAVAGILVRTYDQDLRNWRLGETPTDREGNYKIAYSRDMLSRPEKISADLFVVTVDPTGQESPPRSE